MKKIIFGFFCLSLFAACNSNRTMVDDLNESIADDSIKIEFETQGFGKDGRNLVYLLDPSCSFCIANYTSFLESLGFSTCNYDSLFTIVLNGNYLMNVEYYLSRDSIYRPETERYIIDNEGTLTDYYYTLSNNNTILLFDGGKLIFTSSIWAYKFEEGVGLVREKNN